MNGPTPRPSPLPSSNVACANPSGNVRRCCAVWAPVPAPTKSVATHSVAAGNPRSERSRSTSPPPVPPNPPRGGLAAGACDAKTAFNGDPSVPRLPVRIAVDGERCARTRPEPPPGVRVERAALHREGVYPGSTTRRHGGHVRRQRRERPARAGRETERRCGRRRFGSARDRPASPPPYGGGFATSVRRFVSIRGRVRVLHLGGGGAVEVEVSPRGGAETMTPAVAAAVAPVRICRRRRRRRGRRSRWWRRPSSSSSSGGGAGKKGTTAASAR